MKLRFSNQSIIRLTQDMNIVNFEEFAKDFDATCRWTINGTFGSFVIDFNTEEGYTQFLLMYGDYLK